MRNGMLVVDAHVHIGSFDAVEGINDLIRTKEDLFGFRTRHAEIWNQQFDQEVLDNTDRLVAVMDAQGVDRALVMARPGASDHAVVEMAKRHPDRLVPAIRIVSDQELHGYVEEPEAVRSGAAALVREYVEQHDIRAVSEVFIRGLTRELHPEAIADDLAPIMDVLEEFGLPISFPTGWSQWKGGLYYGDPLWVDEVAGRYPSVPIILCKMGRGFVGMFESALMVAVRNSNVYFDMVQTTPAHLRRAVDSIGAGRILFGTDWDVLSGYVRDPWDVHAWSFNTLEEASLSERDLEYILGRNAERLFGLA